MIMPASTGTRRSPILLAIKSLPGHGGMRVYGAHIGMAREGPKIGPFPEFTADVLPHIADLGYKAVQLRAIMEHPYCGSFGYLVSNFFAVASRFGAPEELKALI